MKKMILTFTFLILLQAQNFNSFINKAHSEDNLKRAQWSLSARYVDTGERIIDHNSEMALCPASGLKLLTTAAALEILGPDHKFQTKIYYDGNILNGTLDGNIYLVGGGDPTLGSDAIEGNYSLDELMNIWIGAVKAAGIEKVNGSIIADDLLYTGRKIPRFWVWEDIGNYYGAQASALCINDNLYELYFKPAKKVGDIAEVIRTVPEIDGLVFENYMKTGARGSGDNGYIYSAPKLYHSILRGSIPQGKPEFKIKGALPEPALFAAHYFTKTLKETGVTVTGNAKLLNEKVNYTKLKLISKIESPELHKIVHYINKRSYNLYAEMLIRAIGYEIKNEGSIEAGAEAINNYLSSKNIDTLPLNIYDGSGLCRSNTVSASLVTDLLLKISKEKYFNSYYNSLGVAGDPDDLSRYKYFGRGTAIEKNARIKSGYFENVRSHSGYVKDKNGRLIAFSFIANNYNGSTGQINNLHKELMIKLAELR